MLCEQPACPCLLARRVRPSFPLGFDQGGIAPERRPELPRPDRQVTSSCSSAFASLDSDSPFASGEREPVEIAQLRYRRVILRPPAGRGAGGSASSTWKSETSAARG